MFTAKIKQFRDYIHKTMQLWGVPGLAITAIKDNEILMQEGFGVADVETNSKVTTHTLFPIGAMTKAFTATSIAMLVDAGKLGWFDNVAYFLPDFYLYDSAVTADIRVLDLLYHNSGLGTLSSSFLGFLGYPEHDIIHKLRYLHPTEEFRSLFQYHNGIYLVAGDLIEKVSKMPWRNFIKKNIFEKLEMTNSLAVLSDQKPEDEIAAPYAIENNKIKLLKHNYFTESFSAAAGIYSNVKDITHWLQFNIQQGRYNHQDIVSRQAMANIFSPHITISFSPILLPHTVKTVDARAYGLGWFVVDYAGHQGLEHAGSVPGGSTFISFLPEHNLGIALMCNANAVRFMLSALRIYFYDLMFDLEPQDYSRVFYDDHENLMQNLAKQKAVLMMENQGNEIILGRFVGFYQNTIYGEVEIFLEQDQLFLKIGPHDMMISLKCLASNKLCFADDNVLGLFLNGSQLHFSELTRGCYSKMDLQLEADGGFGQLISIDLAPFLRVD